ncbi:MAG: flagellar protein FlbD [Actinomycetota bacterium]
MICVTRPNGTEVVVNADLIETVEATPETVITLVDGKKYVVIDTTEQVVERIRLFRAAVIRDVDEPRVASPTPLYVLPRTSDQ